jgi:hypothetical protein
MSYGEYKTTWDEIIYNVKELSTFGKWLNMSMKQLQKKIVKFTRAQKCVIKILKPNWLEGTEILVGLSLMEGVALRKAYRDWHTE